jgi:mannose-6-phosphate isomerase
MAIEHARAHELPKPWGVEDLRPWGKMPRDSGAIGEIWYERPGRPIAAPALLLKLLFTSQPLSIQVHPDDASARSMGLPGGKTEAWYVLSAAPEAQVAVGLNRRLTSQQLRAAIGDGSISDLVQWQTVVQDDIVLVPAGTIHAIGAGLVIAEIQQRNDVTFRLFDHGRHRELHVESAIAVSNAGPADARAIPIRLTESRTLLASDLHFVFERFDLAPNSLWRLEAERETWLLVLSGDARAGTRDIAIGDALFVQADHADIFTGAVGIIVLVAYTGGASDPQLLQPVGRLDAIAAQQRRGEVPALRSNNEAALTNGPMETIE